MSNRDFLDALTAYQEAKKTENVHRSAPPEKSVDEYAAEAIKQLNALIDARCKQHDQTKMALGAA